MTTTVTSAARPIHVARLGTLLLILAMPLPAHAQIGALARKIASKAASQAVGMSGVAAESPRFDDPVLDHRRAHRVGDRRVRRLSR
jgi:hypothetical protein